MKWRFWRSQKEWRGLEASVEHWRNLLRMAEEQLADQADELEGLRPLAKFKEGLLVHPPDERRMQSALMVVDESTPVWSAVHGLLNVMEREELGQALRPGLADSDRAYNNGRAACVADVRAMLLQQWVKARVENRKAKG